MEFLNTIDPAIAILLIGFVSGVVELIKRAFDKDFRACVIIFGAGVAGLVAGLLLEVNIIEASVAGFATSGYITIAQNIGKN